MIGLSVTSGPAVEPVTLAEAKAWMRIDHDSDDTLITSILKAARKQCEIQGGVTFTTTSWLLTLDRFPGVPTGRGWGGVLSVPFDFERCTVRIPGPPLIAVQSIQYLDTNGDLQTLDTSTYVVDAASSPGRVSLAQYKIWPVTRIAPGAVRIAFTAGFGDASAVPEDYKTAIKLLAAHWYENREAANMDDRVKTAILPLAVDMILQAQGNGEYR
jgi:hypothetical protein